MPHRPLPPVDARSWRRISRLLAILGTCLQACVLCAATSGHYNVRDYGALGDGLTLDTPAINRTILIAAEAGGGTVLLPAGTYPCYSIRLRSNIQLRLEPGATILAAEPSPDLSLGYDAPEPNPGADLYQDFGHTHWHNSLIWGEDLENVSITGPGIIDGRGLSRRANRRDYLPEEHALPADKRPELSLPAEALKPILAQKPGPFGYPDFETLPAGVGNKAIALKNCRKVLFRDFTVYHGGHFAILASGVENWTCDNLRIDTNRDGIDIDCCRNVRLSNCTVNTPRDDAICLKSSMALGSPRPTENITITNCQVSGYDEGTLLAGRPQRTAGLVRGGPTGRIKCGTESNGAFRNITISNCVFEYCRGLALESVDGAQMEDITISNLTMRDIVNAPLFIRLGARGRGPGNPPPGTARRIKISSLIATNVSAEHGIILAGLKGAPLEDIELAHILILYAGGGTREQANREVPEMEREYPDPSRYGTMPSHGLFARHVRNLAMNHVELRCSLPDLRPCIRLEEVQGANLDHVKATRSKEGPGLFLREVSGLRTDGCEGLTMDEDTRGPSQAP